MKSNSKAVQESRERKEDQNLKRKEYWVYDLPECIKEIKKAVKRINDKYIKRISKEREDG